jgi:hypothetical protein
LDWIEVPAHLFVSMQALKLKETAHVCNTFSAVRSASHFLQANAFLPKVEPASLRGVTTCGKIGSGSVVRRHGGGLLRFG